jgi:uncharacterized protein YqcC (DUF446 family)
MSDKYERAAAKLAEIEAEMRATGAWQAEELPRPAYFFERAFAADTMTTEQWLQFIFVPRVREALETKSLPPRSQVGTYAVRCFDGEDRLQRLVGLLCELDHIIESDQ